MTQQEHLTIEQLSAFLDKQLTPQEQAFFDAHLQNCQRCQHVLAELRGTVFLLHALPQPPLPRTFTLPAGISQEPAARPQPLPLPARQQRYMLRRTVRAVSTLAAVIAILFILSGLLPSFLHAGGFASSSAGTVPQASSVNTSSHAAPNKQHATEGSGSSTPRVSGTPGFTGHQSSTPSPSSVPSRPVPTPTSSNGTVQHSQTNPPTLPPFLDISQPAGRLLLGAFLLLLGIVGLIATRRRRTNAW